MDSKNLTGRRRGKALIAAALVAAALTVGAASGWVAQPAATAAGGPDIYLKLDSISGESKTHKDAIDVQSWSWGVSQ
jgi:hypothetical protein